MRIDGNRTEIIGYAEGLEKVVGELAVMVKLLRAAAVSGDAEAIELAATIAYGHATEPPGTLALLIERLGA
ncbi:hypothetical protein FBZ83_12355 [Azospirillum brasilense]|uniref:Uncharacterized protein n=1 Tax=Azospirillum brasilense TaxID=192 RepID=A0A560BSN4_AZOBR|nr:hypothetical protein [Azospirillum brasilense]TWA75628.1 hypothetical protein FBZ83_12355 [Azospirillum brasilense]